MSNKCNLIKDILPLYAEDMVSTDTREFVSDHLESCEKCRAELEHMGKPADCFFYGGFGMCHSDGCLWDLDIT